MPDAHEQCSDYYSYAKATLGSFSHSAVTMIVTWLVTDVQPQLACNAQCYIGMQGLSCLMHMSLDSITDSSYAEAEL